MKMERKHSLSETAADFIRDAILGGELVQKDKVVENDIAYRLGMSRGPVREALKQLVYEGFLDYEINKGHTVSMLSPRDAYEVFYLRGNLENLALERCSGRLLRDGIYLMEDAVLSMKEAEKEDDMGKMIRSDEIFHKQILKSGQMERLSQLWETLSPLNGAMFYTVRQVNEYVARTRLKGEEESPSRARRRGNNYLEHKNLLDILKIGDLEQSRHALNVHYIANGERIYRIGMNMKDQDLFRSRRRTGSQDLKCV